MRKTGLHRFAVFTACCTFLLLLAGALVTSNDAGLAVPDWPLSYGSLLPPMVGGILYEHGHRMVAGFVGVLTITLAIWLGWREPRRWVRVLGWVALGGVVTQAVLGGITVRFYLPKAVSIAHAGLAQLFFCVTLSLALFTSRWWQGALPQLEDSASPSLPSLAAATTAAIFLQLIAGAALRHKAIGIVPHLAGAAAVAFLVVWTARAVLRRYGHLSCLRRVALLLSVLLGLQLLLGLGAYWSMRVAQAAPQPMPAMVWLTVAHLGVGALTLATSVLLTLSCFRVVTPARALSLATSPGRDALPILRERAHVEAALCRHSDKKAL